MILAALLAADVDVQRLHDADDAVQLLHDALAGHSVAGYIVAACAALVIIVPLVLKALGKSVPVLDPILKVVVSVLQSFSKPKAPVPEPTEAEKAEQPGVSNVVEIKKLEDK